VKDLLVLGAFKPDTFRGSNIYTVFFLPRTPSRGGQEVVSTNLIPLWRGYGGGHHITTMCGLIYNE
jgi:hypothetical protein